MDIHRRFAGSPQKIHRPSAIAKALRLWNEGFSLEKIAEMMGVTKGVISGIHTRNNFPPRRSKKGP